MAIGIIITFVLGFLCLFLFIVLPLGRRPAGTNDAQPASIAGLSAVHIEHLDVVFGGYDDYCELRARAELESVRRRFRRDRREIILKWLNELQRDTRILWEFRCFLVRSGLRVGLRDEFEIGVTACFSLVYLQILQTIASVFGPFALNGALRSARLPVERLARRGASLLDQVPTPMRAQIQERWSQKLVALRTA